MDIYETRDSELADILKRVANLAFEVGACIRERELPCGQLEGASFEGGMPYVRIGYQSLSDEVDAEAGIREEGWQCSCLMHALDAEYEAYLVVQGGPLEVG